MANLIPQVFGHTSNGCGEPGVDKLTNFTIAGNTSDVKSNANPRHYTNGTIIEYKCNDRNDEIMVKQKTRVCVDGQWKERMPRCGQYVIALSLNFKFVLPAAKNLKNAVFAKHMQLLIDGKAIAKSTVKLTDSLSNKESGPYLASPWPEDCKYIDINNIERQSLVITFNSSLFFNYMKLSLIYPPFQATMLNYMDNYIDMQVLTNQSMKCQVLRGEGTDLKGKHSVTSLINCKVDSNNTKLNVNTDFLSDKIVLKFSFAKILKSKNLTVGLCAIYLYRHLTNDCGRPDKPLYSRISSNVEEGYTQFTCEDEYEISPKKTNGYLMSCDVNGEWDRDFPICVAKTFCKPIPIIGKESPVIKYINAYFDQLNGTNVTTVNTIAEHSCQSVFIDGYETILSPETNPLRTCMGWQWSGSDLKCVPNNFWNKLLGHNLIYLAIVVIIILLSLILILILILCFKSKRVVPKVDLPIDSDSLNNHNYYESVRLSNVSINHNYDNYDYVYQSEDQKENNDSIYEVTDDRPEMDTTDEKSDIVWSLNSTYG